MKKILFLLLLTLQIGFLRAIEENVFRLEDLSKDILFVIVKNQILENISQAKTLTELKKAYKCEEIALISKKYRDIVKEVKSLNIVQEAYKKKKNEIEDEPDFATWYVYGNPNYLFPPLPFSHS